MAIIIQLTLAITILCSSFLAILIYKNQHQTTLHKLLTLHFVSITSWAFCALFALRHDSWTAIKIGYASAAILITTKYYFLILFPTAQPLSRLHQYTPVLLTSGIVLLSLFDGVFVSDFTTVDNAYILITDGPYAHIYMLSVLLLLTLPIINLYKKISHQQYQGSTAEQLKLLFLGVTIFFLLGFTTNSILPVVFHIYYFNGIGPSLALILAGIILYIINKHHFLNLYLIIQRSFVYSVIIAGIATTYLTILFTLDNIIQQANVSNPIFSGLMTCIIGIFLFPHIESYLRKKTDPFFFQDTYNPTTVIQELAETLSHSVEISKIKLHTTRALQQALKASTVSLTIHHGHLKQTSDDSLTLDKKTDSVTLPLISNAQLVGTLTLGKKRSDEPYNKIDLNLLSTISYQLAIACERALLYQQLKDYSRELEFKVHKRTTELHTAYHNQKTMISHIAHGLQTPLTIMTNEVEMLRASNQNADKIILLEHSLNSLSNFIYDLLRLSRVESNLQQFEMNTFDISLLCEEIIAYISILSLEQNVSCTSKIEPGILITGDKKQLEEVIQILLGNALKYLSPTKQRCIHFSLAKHKNQSAVIEITDTGIGIEHDELPKIFDRFYRIKNAKTTNIPGSGLGLSIAKAIILKHAGTIQATSTVGVGTTFTVKLPL